MSSGADENVPCNAPPRTPERINAVLVTPRGGHSAGATACPGASSAGGPAQRTLTRRVAVTPRVAPQAVKGHGSGRRSNERRRAEAECDDFPKKECSPLGER